MNTLFHVGESLSSLIIILKKLWIRGLFRSKDLHCFLHTRIGAALQSHDQMQLEQLAKQMSHWCLDSFMETKGASKFFDRTIEELSLNIHNLHPESATTIVRGKELWSGPSRFWNLFDTLIVLLAWADEIYILVTSSGLALMDPALVWFHEHREWVLSLVILYRSCCYYHLGIVILITYNRVALHSCRWVAGLASSAGISSWKVNIESCGWDGEKIAVSQ